LTTTFSTSADRTHGAAPSVFCILVNWNGWSDTKACLRSLRQQDYSALTTVVVDNGSTDDSCALIRTNFPEVVLIEAGANLGFACGSNLGIRHAMAAGAAYIWLLNNDTIAPTDTCSKLVAKSLSNPSAGIVGSVLYYMHDPARVQAWGGGDINVWIGRSTHCVEPFVPGADSYLTFASVLIPRHIIEAVGILYEGYFMYFDDTDFALRVTRAGYGLTVATDTAVLHKEGGSAAPRSPLTDRLSAAAGLHFLRRHSPVPLLSMAIFLANKFAIRVLRHRWANIRAIGLAIGDYRRQRLNHYTDKL
jgi:GT2 family glycosyltransferase